MPDVIKRYLEEERVDMVFKYKAATETGSNRVFMREIVPKLNEMLKKKLLCNILEKLDPLS